MTDGPSRPARGAHQLPPGRHGLSRSFVARNQRERILAAVALASAEVGFARMSVDDIVRRAGVSRRTFYEQFDNKEAAFFEAFDEAASRLVSSVRAAYKDETTFDGRVIAGFRALLEVLAATPTFAHMCIVDVLAAGPEALERRRSVMTEFANLIEEASHLAPRIAPLPAMTAETIVGGVYEALFRRISSGETAALPSLLPDLMESALLPYLGEEAAVALAARLREPEAEPPLTPALDGAGPQPLDADAAWNR
jgi:AcrR family transcriptional regulator